MSAGQKTIWHRIWHARRLYLYVAPSILLLLTFSYYPAISGLWHAFYDWRPVAEDGGQVVSEEMADELASGQALPEASDAPLEEATWVGLGNFIELYDDLFGALPQLASPAWTRMQRSIWLAMGLLVAFFVLTEWEQSRPRAWQAPLAWGLGACAAAMLAVSLVSGWSKWQALREVHHLADMLVGHAALLALSGAAVWGWRRHRATRQDGWWHLTAWSVAASVVLGIAMLVRLTAPSDLRSACANLITVMTFSLTIGLFMPLLVAEILFHMRSDRWKYAYRVAFIIPMVVPGMVGLLMWQFIYDYDWGVLNKLIGLLKTPGMQVALLLAGYALVGYLLVMFEIGRRRRGARLAFQYWFAMAALLMLPAALLLLWRWMDVQPRNWLGDTNIALYAIMCMGFPWVGTISMLIFYAGLQAISPEVLESARLDGAEGLRRFFSIDFPLILGQFKLLLILGIIGGIQGFGSVLILTYGGPGKSTEMPGLTMFKEAFNYGRLGYGTTIGVAMFLIILSLTYVNMRYIRPSAEEESR